MRIYTVDGKRVEIVERFTHTTTVKFVKSGQTINVRSDFVKSFIPSQKKTTKKGPSKNDGQTKLF